MTSPSYAQLSKNGFEAVSHGVYHGLNIRKSNSTFYAHTPIWLTAFVALIGITVAPDRSLADKEPVTVAVIGDFGGDNNYGSHSATGYDAAIGQYYTANSCW